MSSASVLEVLLESSDHRWPLDWERAVESAEMQRLAFFEDLWRFDLGDCEHGYDVRTLIENDDLHWGLNSYVVAPNLRPEEGVYILFGFHDVHERRHWYYRSTPDFTFCLPWAWSPLGVLYRWG